MEDRGSLGEQYPTKDAGKDEKSSAKRGRLRIANVGGSLTVLLQIALLAWGVRQLRSVLAKRRERAENARRVVETPFRPVDMPKVALLSRMAVKMLQELNPVTHFILDVRHPDAAKEFSAPLEAVINVPELEIKTYLELPEVEWVNRFPCTKKPRQSDLLVFLSMKGRRAQRAATIAADLGYSGCCVLLGGIEGYGASTNQQVDPPLKFLGRDAVATLLATGKTGEQTLSVQSHTHLIDVRRHDERALYGDIRGSLHVPVGELPRALSMDSSFWEKNYHCPKIEKNDIVIFYCRTNKRASWAGQLAQDAGFQRCFVYSQGVYGWRLDPTVLPYDSYELGDAPPDPVKFEVEQVDHEAAKQQIQHMGIT